MLVAGREVGVLGPEDPEPPLRQERRRQRAAELGPEHQHVVHVARRPGRDPRSWGKRRHDPRECPGLMSASPSASGAPPATRTRRPSICSAPGGQQPEREREEPVLLLLDAPLQRLLGVAVQHRHRGLRDDGAGVGALVHQVHGASGHLHPVLQGLPVRVQAGEAREEGRVHVEHPAREGAEEGRAHQTHEAGEAERCCSRRGRWSPPAPGRRRRDPDSPGGEARGWAPPPAPPARAHALRERWRPPPRSARGRRGTPQRRAGTGGWCPSPRRAPRPAGRSPDDDRRGLARGRLHPAHLPGRHGPARRAARAPGAPRPQAPPPPFPGPC